jgi:transposase
MDELSLTPKELSKLKKSHRKAKERRKADRIKAVILRSTGWTVSQVAEVLLMDEDTVRNYVARFRRGGLAELLNDNYKGGLAFLSEKELEELDAHLQERLYQTVQEIVAYVEQRFKVRYSVRGMTEVLHRLKFTYKKPAQVPGKANREAQEAFIERYEELKETKGENDPIYFVDGVHPQHNTMIAYGWIKRGEDKEIKTNSGRERLNINGALNIENMDIVTCFDPTINAQSTLGLLRKLEAKHPEAETIYVVCDNARYYRCILVNEYLKDSRVEILFLPSYSPNLNLIERLWKFFKKKVLYNRYYEKFAEFKAACETFFRYPRRYLKELRSLLTENFHLFGTAA